MSQFYYNFLDTFLERADLQLCEMDTDSLYLALRRPALEEVVNLDVVNVFYSVYDSWFPSDVCRTHKSTFINAVGIIRRKKCVACRDCKIFIKELLLC